MGIIDGLCRFRGISNAGKSLRRVKTNTFQVAYLYDGKVTDDVEFANPKSAARARKPLLKGFIDFNECSKA